jgi:CheY-like chemotaxis protein
MASIVIIEDEALLSRQFVRALEGSAHEAQAADTGESGLKLVREVHPDLVIPDWRLPDRSGLDLLLDIRQLDATLPVMLMTAYGSVSEDPRLRTIFTWKPNSSVASVAHSPTARAREAARSKRRRAGPRSPSAAWIWPRWNAA